ncbi:hypothetical protein ACFL5I_00710 [Planctomycetota bacterium]
MTKLKQSNGMKWGMLLVLVLVLGLGLQGWALESKGFVAPTKTTIIEPVEPIAEPTETIIEPTAEPTETTGGISATTSEPVFKFSVGTRGTGIPGESISLAPWVCIYRQPDLVTITGFSMTLSWNTDLGGGVQYDSCTIADTIWEDGGEVEVTHDEISGPGGPFVFEVRHPGVPGNSNWWDSLDRIKHVLHLIFNVSSGIEEETVVELVATDVVFYGPNGETFTPWEIENGEIYLHPDTSVSIPEDSLSIENNYKALPGGDVSIQLKGKHTEDLTGYSVRIEFDPALVQLSDLSIASTVWEENADIMESEVDNELGFFIFEVQQLDDVSPESLNKVRTFLTFTAEVDPDVLPGTVIDLDITEAAYYGPSYPLPDPNAPYKIDGTITVVAAEAIFEFRDELVGVEQTCSFFLYGRFNPELLGYGGEFADVPGIVSIDLEGTVAEGGTIETTLDGDTWSFTVTPPEPILSGGLGSTWPFKPMLRVTVSVPTAFEGMNIPLDLLSSSITWDNGGSPETTDAALIDGNLSIYYRAGSMTLSLDKEKYQPGETVTLTLSGEWFMEGVLAFGAAFRWDPAVMQLATGTAEGSISFPAGFSDYFNSGLWAEYNPWSENTNQEHVNLHGRAMDVPGMPGPGNGDLGYVTFTVPISATPGVYPIEFGVPSFGLLMGLPSYIDESIRHYPTLEETEDGIPFWGHEPEAFNTSIEIIPDPVPLPPEPVTLPNPVDGAILVSLTPQLSWAAAARATSYDVYFGTSDPLPYQTNITETSYNPGTLEPNTRYYWRIDSKNDVGPTTGDVWSFQTISFSFLPGDVNADGAVNILDIVYIINLKYKGGPMPTGHHGNVNEDDSVNILDIVYLINYKYKGGPDPLDGTIPDGWSWNGSQWVIE